MIERRKPLARQGLKPPTAAQVRAWNDKPRKPLARATTPLRRATKAIAKVGPKARREASALAEFRKVVKARRECQAPVGVYAPDGRWITVPHSPWPHAGAHAHHVWPEDHDAGVHDPARGLYLCGQAHDWSHLNPADAAIVGTLRPVTPITPSAPTPG